MGLSLRDQLLQSGLANEKQAKQIDRQKKKQQRLEHKGQAVEDTKQKALGQKAIDTKLQKDQELNRLQQDKMEKKARSAQVKQLIDSSRLPKLTTEDYYNFVDGKKVKRISVNNLMRGQLSKGVLAIVRFSGNYEIVPRDIALKVQEREAHKVVLLNTVIEEDKEDDPYAAYQVPDDLMW